MKTRIAIIISMLLLAFVLAACDSGSAATSSAANSAPSGAPAAQSTMTGRAPGAAGSAPVASATQTAVKVSAASTISNAPTAVPAPVIAIPTPLAAGSTAQKTSAVTVSTSAGAGSTAGTAGAAAASAPTLADLHGKIIFFSDRDGYAQLYVMDTDGSNQRLCNCSDLLATVVSRETASPDGNQFLYYKVVGSARGGSDQQIWAHNNTTGWEAVVTGAAPGFPGVDYDAVWSPDSKHIAFVTEVNGFDEIYLYDASEGSTVRLTQSASEWYKHPTFSTDGSHIAYWTNSADVLHKQIWVMSLDGSGKTNVSNNAYNDWDPVWVK